MTLRTVPLPDGGHLTARLDGPDGAPVIALANSVLTDLRIWEAQIPELTKAFRVLRYDQRGHGGSSLASSAMTFADYGADLLAVADALGVDRFGFVGLSMGVPTGLAALAQAPDRFTCFVAVDGVSRSAPGREAFWAERRETARRDGMAVIASTTVSRWLPWSETAPMASVLRDMITATPVEGFATATQALASYDCSPALDLLRVPFLGIAGSLDGAMPEAMRQQFAALPNATFTEIEEAGHLPNFQRPDAFNTALSAFLTTQLTTQEMA